MYLMCFLQAQKKQPTTSRPRQRKINKLIIVYSRKMFNQAIAISIHHTKGKNLLLGRIRNVIQSLISFSVNRDYNITHVSNALSMAVPLAEGSLTCLSATLLSAVAWSEITLLSAGIGSGNAEHVSDAGLPF